VLRSIRASFCALAIVTLGCGRGGLGDFDVDGETGVEDSAADAPNDSAILFDTSVEFDTTGEFDTFVEFDTSGEFDTGSFDTFIDPEDTGTFDTFVEFDTGSFDTFVEFDTGSFDTFVEFDTGVFDTGDFDTGTFDTSIFDTGTFETSFDTGPDTPVEGGILCGGSTCSAATQECCANFTGLSCVAKGACMGGTTINCSSALSCSAGQICCFSGLGGGTPTANCQPFCFGVQLCASNAECRAPQRCVSTFGGYKICR